MQICHIIMITLLLMHRRRKEVFSSVNKRNADTYISRADFLCFKKNGKAFLILLTLISIFLLFDF